MVSLRKVKELLEDALALSLLAVTLVAAVAVALLLSILVAESIIAATGCTVLAALVSIPLFFTLTCILVKIVFSALT